MEWLTNLLSTYGAEVLLTANLGVISLKTFVIDKIMNKKIGNNINDNISFQSLAKNEINKVAKVVIDGFDDIKKELVKEVVNPLVAEIKGLRGDNKFLQDALIGLIPYVNVPIAQKEGFYKVVKTISSVSGDVKYAMEQALIVENSLNNTSIEIDKGIELEIEGV